MKWSWSASPPTIACWPRPKTPRGGVSRPRCSRNSRLVSRWKHRTKRSTSCAPWVSRLVNDREKRIPVFRCAVDLAAIHPRVLDDHALDDIDLLEAEFGTGNAVLHVRGVRKWCVDRY